MKHVYAAALTTPRVRGKRYHDVRSEALLRAVTTQDGPYRKIAHGVQQAYDTMFKAVAVQLWADLNAVFERTRHDVNQVCSTKEDDSSEAKRMREDLLGMLPDARECLEKYIKRELAKCRQGRSSTRIEE